RQPRGRRVRIELAVALPAAGLDATKIEAARIDAQLRRLIIGGGPRDEVQRTTERAGAVTQAVGALVDLGIAERGRIDLLEIGAAVGGIERHAVLIQLHAAQMKIARKSGTANRQAGVLAPFRLRENAGRVVEHV